jgi:MoaA/NifB/PqqE/SkfB family radical SAM enzyme
MYNRVIISGGEASINPKFIEYIRYAKDIGYDKVQTVTNGNMFSRKEFCEKVFLA